MRWLIVWIGIFKITGGVPGDVVDTMIHVAAVKFPEDLGVFIGN